MYAVGMVQKGFDGYAIPSLSLSPAFPGSEKLRADYMAHLQKL